VNFLAHLEVARRRLGASDPTALLGAMLPDLISVTSLKVGDLDRWPAGTAAGIRCHRRADEAFHADLRFVHGITALRDELMAAGIQRGPARAAAHVSWELLLDGTLLGAAETRDAYLGALASPAPAWAPMGEAAEVDRWAEVVRRYRERGLPVSIDAATTASRVVDLLARRPRIALDRALTPVLAAALGEHQPSVVAAADAVIDATAAA
jgi:hypothetical protein